MQRLGKNIGRYFGETINIDQVQEEAHQLALSTGFTSETFLDRPGKTLRAYFRAAKNLGSHTHSPGARNFYFSTGIHGDEPSGPIAMLELLKLNAWPNGNIWLVPCLNPSGFRLNSRFNDAGIDLNRDYRSGRSEEVRAHLEWLKRQPPFWTSIILHEDWEANGFYIYEVNPNALPSIAEPIIASLRPNFPIEHADQVDTWPHKDGIIRPPFTPEERPEWAEALWLIANKTLQSCTFEAPSDFPLQFRVSAQVAAMRRAFELLA